MYNNYIIIKLLLFIIRILVVHKDQFDRTRHQQEYYRLLDEIKKETDKELGGI